MSQCEKVLENGERCSNRAEPGTSYCRTHAPARTIFRPRSRPVADDDEDSPPPPKLKPSARRPQWRAAPWSGEDEPEFPGLRADERQLLVAPEGCICLTAAKGATESDQFSRLVRLIGLLSQSMPLPGRLRITHPRGAREDVVFLTAPEGEKSLSHFFDAAAAAAQFAAGQLFVGQGQDFVRYRNEGAPRGYDVPGFTAPPAPEKAALSLIDHLGTRWLNGPFEETALAEFCLRVAPLPGRAGPQPPPEQVSVLAPSPLYWTLARYFQAHHLGYRVARLQGPDGMLILFEVSPRAGAPTGGALPPFVIDYLASLPRVSLFRLAHEAGASRILLQWNHRYPLAIDHMAEVFAGDQLVLLGTDPYPNLRVQPAPAFFDGDPLLAAHVPQPQGKRLLQAASGSAGPVTLPVLLRPDRGPVPPIAAVILTDRELDWLRRLLYRLPGDALAGYTLCLGEGRSVLLGGERSIEGVPFGEPLRRHRASELFLPLLSRLVPDLPWPNLQQAFEIQEGVYTFLTASDRLDVPTTAFFPLSRALVAEPGRPRVQLKVLPTPVLPEIHWQAPAPPPPSVAAPAAPKGRQAGSQKGGPSPAAPSGPPSVTDIDTYLRGQAKTYEEAGDHLAAAFFYSVVNDPASSARCFRRASETFQADPGGREGT
jgi:hypothetical protein